MCWNVDYVNVIHVNGNLVVTCDRYRKARCQACNSFNIAKENLFKILIKREKITLRTL